MFRPNSPTHLSLSSFSSTACLQMQCTLSCSVHFPFYSMEYTISTNPSVSAVAINRSFLYLSLIFSQQLQLKAKSTYKLSHCFQTRNFLSFHLPSFIAFNIIANINNLCVCQVCLNYFFSKMSLKMKAYFSEAHTISLTDLYQSETARFTFLAGRHACGRPDTKYTRLRRAGTCRDALGACARGSIIVDHGSYTMMISPVPFYEIQYQIFLLLVSDELLISDRMDLQQS